MNENRAALIDDIRRLPGAIAALTAGLTADQLTAHPLMGEWSVAQNVHHLADSHMHSYIRCKLIKNEDHPTLKPYDQDVWAALPDAQAADISTSLALLGALHTRWVAFWQALDTADWQRSGYHPENGVVTLESQLAGYAAHGRAHIDQIRRTLAAAGVLR